MAWLSGYFWLFGDTMKHHILIVEDDHNTLMTLAYLIEHAGYAVTQAADGKTACHLLKSQSFAVVLTDIILGDVSGIDVLLTARSQASRPEVILLTGHGSLDTAMAAVNEGAFAYLLKPCFDSTLLASIEKAVKQHVGEQEIQLAAANLFHALTHRQSPGVETAPAPSATQPFPSFAPMDKGTKRVGNLGIGDTHHDVTVGGVSVPLTPIEYALLSYLAQYPGKVCRYRDIIYATHQLETNNADAQILLAPHIRNLRQKLGASSIETARGIGYILVAQE
jgi:DNA-binding response OmpR family regulator